MYLEEITKSKIVATLGPASSSEEIIGQMVLAGMDCARLNFSHGTHEFHTEMFKKVRKISNKIPIMFDIQGPKIRIGELDNNYILHTEDEFILTTDDIIGNNKRATIRYKNLINELNIGDKIFINDGVITLIVTEITEKDIKCSILSGGPISSNKGVNVPHVNLSVKVPTEKDIKDISLAAKLGADFLAVSFVSNVDEIINIKKILIENGGSDTSIVSKIERPVALEHLDDIIGASTGVMVARGDLGVELSPENVPVLQKEIILKCNRAGRPVICATQMLESMILSPIPTRAEASDCFNAIFDGADALMLSAETASGKYPVQAIHIMDSIVRRAETILPKTNPSHFNSSQPDNPEIIGHATHTILKNMEERGNKVAAILVVTSSGYSANMIAKYRPQAPIIACTFNENMYRKMFLIWGVESLLLDVPEEMDQLSKNHHSIKAALKEGFIKGNDDILLISGSLLAPKAKTCNISLYNVKNIEGLGI